MEDDENLMDEVLKVALASYNKLGWNEENLKADYRAVKMFIYTQGIREGSVTVPTDLIYYSYHKTKGEDAMPRRRFVYMFKLFFPMFKGLGRNVFKMDPIPLGLEPNYSFYKDPRFWKRKKRSTVYKGVRPAPYGEWIAEITINYKKELVGYFNTSKAAAKAWNEAMLYYYGEGAPQNKIHGKKVKDKKPKREKEQKLKKYKAGTMARSKRKKTSKE